MKWATRPRCHVDRAASAWLIVREIDPEAEFFFVDDLEDVPAKATPFDMRGADLSHHGADCTFETILRRHGLEERALWRIAEIIHEADLRDDRFDAPEAVGLDALVNGLRMTISDAELLAITRQMFDGLFALYSQEDPGAR